MPKAWHGVVLLGEHVCRQQVVGAGDEMARRDRLGRGTSRPIPYQAASFATCVNIRSDSQTLLGSQRSVGQKEGVAANFEQADQSLSLG